MSVEDNKNLIRRYINEVWNSDNLNVIKDFIDPGYMAMDGSKGPNTVRDHVRRLRNAFPDLSISINEIVAENDTIVAHVLVEGTPIGNIRKIPPSHKKITWWEIVFWKIKDGKIISSKLFADMLGIVQGMGIVPTVINKPW